MVAPVCTVGQLSRQFEEFEHFLDDMAAACGLLQTGLAELEPEGPMDIWAGFMSDDAQTRARSANAVACFSPERVFVERERRERPPRRYDKSDAAASEIR